MYNVLVVFNDNSKKIFNDVIDWGSTASNTCYYIKKNVPINIENYNTVMAFIRIDDVKYIGPVEFWEDMKEFVYCEDCGYCRFDKKKGYICNRPCLPPMQKFPNEFCSGGVRRKEE